MNHDEKSCLKTSDAKIAAAIFLVAFAVLFWFNGNRFVPTNDEGILLEPARQITNGERPYVDFFGYMSPGSYWIQAAWFRIFGLFLWVGRLPTLLDLSVQSALVFWITSRLSSRRAGWAAAIVFFGFQIADPSFLTAQHRWDSGTLALLGLWVVVARASFSSFALGGALIAAAAWCTPSMALLLVVVAVWILSRPMRWRLLTAFCGGVASVTLAAIAWLAGQGSLTAFLQQMVWLQKNYSSVNVMTYGSVIGGYKGLLEGQLGPETALRIILIVCLALPAILPPLCAVLWVWLFRQTRRGAGAEPLKDDQVQIAALFVPAVAALVATAFPRADVMHLSFVVALPYALTAAAFARLLSLRAGAILAFTMIPFAVLFSLNGITSWFSTRPIDTPAGRIRVLAKEWQQFHDLFSAVRSGDSLYVYPYMPIQYFVTQAKNPTRFCYLNAGMMTKEDETQVLTALESNPPTWLMYMPLTREEFLRVFPGGNDSDHRFQDVEGWIEKNYVRATNPTVNLYGYQLMKRQSPAVAVNRTQ